MNEKTKKEGYTDQLNQELLGTLGEKASSEQISAAYEKREVHRDTTYHKTNTKHASPWKDTAPVENTLKTRKKKHRSSRDRYFLLLSLGIAVGVLTAAGLLIYGSLLFTNRRPAGKSEKIYLWVFFCEERFVFLEKRRKKHIL